MRLALMLAWMTLTRVPITPRGRLSRAPNATDLARATIFYPLIGALVGASSAGLGQVAGWLHHSAQWQAALTLVASLLLTGAMHHDGLADSCDALGAGTDRERALSIMRDSRIGTFGSLALIFAIGLEWQALVSLIEDGTIVVPYACAHMFGRLCAALVLALAEPARTHDQSLAASSIRACTWRYAWAASGLWVALSWWVGLTSLIVLLATAWTFAALCWHAARRRWGGITGDVVGATVVVATLLHLWLVGCKN